MKQFFRFFTLLAVAVVTSVQAWAIDVPLPKAQPVTVGTECYILNVGTKLFLGQGEAWGTQAVANKTGLKYIIKNQRDDGAAISFADEATELPEGQYWLYSPEISGAAGHCTDRWQDGTCGTEYRCSFTDQTDWDSRGVWQFAFVSGNIFTMQVPEGLPDFTDFQNLYVPGEYAGIDPERSSNCANPTYGLYSDLVYADAPEKCQFYCVTVNDHDVYRAKLTLAEYIDKATALDIDVTAYVALINSETVTADEVNAASAELYKKLEDANPWDNPKDITDQYILTPLPIAGASAGWTILDEQGGETSIGTCSNNIGEFWNKSGCSIHYTMKDLPVGVYTLRMEGWTRTGMVAVLKVGDNQVNLATVSSSVVNTRAQGRSWIDQGDGHGINEISWVQLEAGDVEISLTADNTTADYWMCWGHFWLLDRGYKMRSFQEAAKALADNWQDEFLVEDEETGELVARSPFTQDYFDAVSKAVESIPTSTNTETALAIYKQVQQTLNDLRKNVSLYAELKARTYDEDNFKYEDPMSPKFGGEAGFPDIWDEAQDIFNDEDYTKSNEYLEDLLNRYMEARQNAIDAVIDRAKPGESVVGYIENPSFKSEDGSSSSFRGWTVESSSSFQNNSGSVPVIEQWNGSANTGVIDVYQNIAIKRIGAYRLKTKGWYRSSTHQDVHDSQEGYTTVNTYLYGASSEYKFHDIYDHPYTPAEKQKYFPKGNCYDPVSGDGYSVNTDETDDEFIARMADAGVETVMPNNVTGANELFNNEEVDWYDMTCDFLGLGKEYPVKIGVRGRDVPGWAWLIWDDFDMIYLGSDLETMKPIAQDAATAATEEFYEGGNLISPMSAAAKANLDNRINGIVNATDVDGLVEAYRHIDEARANARTSIAGYQKVRTELDKLNDKIQEKVDEAMDDRLNAAVALSAEIEDALADGSIADDAIDATIKRIQEAISGLNLNKNYEYATKENPVDLSDMITNRLYFDGYEGVATMSGWTYDGINNVEAEQSVIGFAEGWGSSAEAATFDIYQDIIGLPKGTYEVRVSGLFRQGGVDAEVKMSQYGYAEQLGKLDLLNEAAKTDVQEYNGAGQFYAVGEGLEHSKSLHRWIFIGTDEWTDAAADDFMSSGDGAYIEYVDSLTEEGNPAYYYFPDNRANLYGRVMYDYYDNTGLFVNVGEDGVLRIGARNQNATAYDWTPFSNWRLFYYGTDARDLVTGISRPEENVNTLPDAIYSIDGRRMSQLQKGLNIVVRNGKAQKVLVK